MCALTTCVLVFDSYAGKHDRSGSCVIEHGRIDIKTFGACLWEARSGSCVMEHGRILACLKEQGVWSMIRLGKKRSDQRAILKDGKRDVAWDMWSQIHSLDVERPRPL